MQSERSASRETPDYSDLTVVIPTLNEAESIERVIDEVLEVGVPRERILVVDGGSTDGTREKAEAKGVRVILQRGKGKADAVKTALEEVDTEYVLLMDGDWTYPARYIPVLYGKAREECLDLVIGARVWGEEAQPLVFRIGNRLLTGLFNLLFGTRLRDVLSGMYVVRRSALRDAMFSSRGFGIEAEIASHIASTSGRIGEVEIEYRKRLGKKKLSVRHGVDIALEMLRMAWYYNPAFLFFTVSAVLLLIPGLALGLLTAYRYFALGHKHYVDAIIAVVLSSAGVVALLLSANSVFLKRMEFRLRRLLAPLDCHPGGASGGKGGGDGRG